MAPANRYLEEVYRSAFNAEFIQPALEEGSAFVPWIGGGLGDYLCEVYERTVGKDNCVAFEGMALQIPADRHRMHYVRVKVRVHRYPGAARRLPRPPLPGSLRCPRPADATPVQGHGVGPPPAAARWEAASGDRPSQLPTG